MYFGSVKFFRHLIVGVLCTYLVGITVFGVVMLVRYNKLEAQYLQLQQSMKSSVEIDPAKSGDSSPGGATQEPAETTTKPAPTTTRPQNITTEFAYQGLYPDMVCQKVQVKPRASKTVYLTFDDGPVKNTEAVLDILKKHNIKATFFVVGNNLGNEGVRILKRVQSEGHTIGIHTQTHVYKTIYASVAAFLNDFNTVYEKVYAATGVRPTIFRFPGGSKNNFNKAVYQDIVNEMQRRNFVYYDWNVSGEDSVGNATKESIKRNVLNQALNKDNPIVLLHDTKTNTTAVLDEIITTLQANNFSFATLDPSVESVAF